MKVRVYIAALAVYLAGAAQAAETPAGWQPVSVHLLQTLDDDVARNIATPGFFDGVEISELRIRENGFDWHLIRFRNSARPHGPLWIVPHDDENAAFDAMIATLREHGGVGIAVNSGRASLRAQPGHGSCGPRRRAGRSCDPNRNFDAATPFFTSAFLDQRPDGQPVIALHTNSPGFAGDRHGGQGDLTILDRSTGRRGRRAPRTGGIFATNPSPIMANDDTLGLTPYLARQGRPARSADRCGRAIANAGIHFWHEPVRASDGSMSNYLALNRPDVRYFNAESRTEADLAVAASRHRVIVAAYLQNCTASLATTTNAQGEKR